MSKTNFVGWGMMLGGYGCFLGITYICWNGELATFYKSMSDNLQPLGVSAVVGFLGTMAACLDE